VSAQPAEDGALQPALQRLHNAISALIDPKPHHHHGQIHWVDSHYDQLRDAVAGQTGPRSGGANHSPIWTNALVLLQAIDTAIHSWRNEPCRTDETPHPSTTTPNDTPKRLQTLSAAKWRPQDTAQLETWAAHLENWTRKISALLDPEPTIYLPDPCPICGAETIETSIDGETGHNHAIVIRATGALCQRCREVWDTPQRLRILGRMLGYPGHTAIAE
jgi:hypothetical protein